MKPTDMPFVSNYPVLDAWLKKIGARCYEQSPVGDPYGDHYPKAYLETWQANGHVFIVEVRAMQNGWNVYTCADTNAIDATLLDVERRIGITK